MARNRSKTEEGSTLRDELTSLLNRHNREHESNTPDFILAQYILEALDAFDKATVRRDDWYGHKPWEKQN